MSIGTGRSAIAGESPRIPEEPYHQRMVHERTRLPKRKLRRKKEPLPVPRAPHLILQDLGDPQCPHGSDAPTPELLRECRASLGLSMVALSKALGSEARNSGYIVTMAERGERPLKRAERMLLVQLMQRRCREADRAWT